MRIVVFAATLLIGTAFGLPANAQEKMSSVKAAQTMGYVLAGEVFCGLSYDPRGIEVWIEENLMSGDMDFSVQLPEYIDYAKLNEAKMSASAKIAHCVQIRRVAKFYKFIAQ